MKKHTAPSAVYKPTTVGLIEPSLMNPASTSTTKNKKKNISKKSMANKKPTRKTYSVPGDNELKEEKDEYVEVEQYFVSGSKYPTWLC